jgi:hypothetical protein
MKNLFLFSFLMSGVTGLAQKPPDGTYTYRVAFTEWGGKSLGATCTIRIKGDSIWVIHNGKKNVSGRKNEIIDKGIILKHNSGKWIIGISVEDKEAKDIGGCTDGPRIIDFKNKKIWFC